MYKVLRPVDTNDPTRGFWPRYQKPGPLTFLQGVRTLLGPLALLLRPPGIATNLQSLNNCFGLFTCILVQQYCCSDPALFFSQGLTCSNLKGLMHSAKQPEIALYGATNSSVSSQLLPTVVSCVIPTGRRYCKNLLTPHRRSKFPEVFLKLTRLYFLDLKSA